MTFELTSKQKEANEVLAGIATHEMLFGGSRCVAGDTILDGQVKTIKQLAEAGNPVEVVTSWGKQLAEAPYKKGSAAMLKVTVESGATITVTPDHRFFDGSKWIKAEELSLGDLLSVQNPLESSSELFQLEFLSSVQHLKNILLGYLDDCLSRHHLSDGQLHSCKVFYQVYCASQSDERGHIHENQYPTFLASVLRGLDTHVPTQGQHVGEYNHSYPLLYPQPTKDVFQETYLDEQLLSSYYEQIFLWFQDLQSKYRLTQPLSSQEQLVQLVESGLIYQFYQFLSLSFDTPNSYGYGVSRVSEISASPIEDYYTIHVPLTEQYFANGFLNHNSGKTFLICRNIVLRALLAPTSRHGIFRYRYNAIKSSIMMDTMPKVFKLCFPKVAYELNKTEGIFYLPNGSSIVLGGLDDGQRVEKLLGLEFATLYLNETSQIPFSSRNLIVTRLAQKVLKLDGTVLTPRMYYDANPPSKSHWTYKMFVLKIDPESKRPLTAPQDYSSFQINPVDNTANVSEGYLNILKGMSSKMQKRFLFGEFSDEGLDTLFKEDNLARNAVTVDELPEFTKIVIAVDPSGASDATSKGDAIGIVVVGLGVDKIAYVLKDATIKAAPAVWSQLVTDLFDDYEADLVITEINYGGAMVKQVLRASRSNLPIKVTTSTRGKHLRAEPVATLYEQDKVKHLTNPENGVEGGLFELEEELLGFTSTGYIGDRSPNRADALVFAVTELFNAIIATPRSPREGSATEIDVGGGILVGQMQGRRRVRHKAGNW